jgi:hypothetical protein
MDSTLNTITKLRLADGREVAFVDWTDQPLFSTCEYQHGATIQEMNLFNYVIGDQVPAAGPAGAITRRTSNENDTNMAAAGSMASTEEMLVYAIKPEVLQMTLGTTRNFTTWAITDQTGEPIPTPVCYGVLNALLKLNLEISQKVYASAGFGWFNSGFGVVNAGRSQAGDADTGRGYANNGVQSQEAVRSFVISQHIGGQEKFRVQLLNAGGVALNIGNAENNAQKLDNESTGALATSMVRIRIYLDGLHKRPVS